MQRETLDSLKEGVAVFGTDGRLKLFNSAFAEIWRSRAAKLAEEPHVDEFMPWRTSCSTSRKLGRASAAP